MCVSVVIVVVVFIRTLTMRTVLLTYFKVHGTIFLTTYVLLYSSSAELIHLT